MSLLSIRELHKFLNLKTYQVGLAQEKTYRALYKKTEEILGLYDLVPLEWAFLGLIHEHDDSLIASVAADMLAVEKAYTTKMSKKLTRAGYIETILKSGNKKNHYLILTAQGQELMSKLEPILFEQMKPIMQSVGKRDLLGYLRTIFAMQQFL